MSEYFGLLQGLFPQAFISWAPFITQHPVVEMRNFLEMEKGETQSVSSFYVQVRTKGLEISASPELIKIVFPQGLDYDFHFDPPSKVKLKIFPQLD